MGKAEASTVKELRAFKQLLSKRMVVQQMILYGSRARGDYLKHSDVDVIVVSDGFKSIPFLERIYQTSKYWKYDLPLEVFCYTSEEFAEKKKESSYMKMILKEGISV